MLKGKTNLEKRRSVDLKSADHRESTPQSKRDVPACASPIPPVPREPPKETQYLIKGAQKTDIRKDYLLKGVLGRGSFATVVFAENISTKDQFAVKILDKRHPALDSRVLNGEVGILRHIDHPNIVRLFDVYESPERVYLVTELCTGGELFDRILRTHRHGGYSEREASNLSQKIFSALEYMHRRGVVHRDLKPENIMFVSEDPDSSIKITDFGLSARIRDRDESMMIEQCGTPLYFAPELVRREAYTSAVDMWSTGVILFILLSGSPPFPVESEKALFPKITAGDYSFSSPQWERVSSSAKDLVTRLLEVEPTRRYTAEQALSHPWIRGTTIFDDDGLSTAFEELSAFAARFKKTGTEDEAGSSYSESSSSTKDSKDC